jgi:hypothetical protein
MLWRGGEAERERDMRYWWRMHFSFEGREFPRRALDQSCRRNEFSGGASRRRAIAVFTCRYDRHSLDTATFDAIKTRLLTHFNVSVAPFGPRGSSRERRAWVYSIKLKYRNARRLIFARAMTQYIAQRECVVYWYSIQ